MSVAVGVIVIGRNEAARLRGCLLSVLQTRVPLLYVDSQSTDESLDVARSLAVDFVELDHTRPVSAARARNEGFDRLLKRIPQLRFVQFLDGDCTLFPEWIERGAQELSRDARRAAVIGHLVERNADASVYNRLCAIEWSTPVGDLRDYGVFCGISLVRADVFRNLGGFNPDVIAGEDSELAVRMQLAGYKITKIDCPMATHDANMRTFGQWWTRAVRSGHAIGQRADLHGSSRVRDCVRERRSTLFWGLALPIIVLCSALASPPTSLCLAAAYPLLGFKVWRRRRRMGHSRADALLYAASILLAKFANAIGLVRFFVNKLLGRYLIIEYK